MAKNMWEIRTKHTYSRRLLEPAEVASLSSRGFILKPFVGNDKKEIPTVTLSKAPRARTEPPHGSGRATNYARQEVLSNIGKIRPDLTGRHNRRMVS